MKQAVTVVPANLMHMSQVMSHAEEQGAQEAPGHLTLVGERETEAPLRPFCCSCRSDAVVRFAENDFCGDCFHRVSADLFGPR